MDHIIEGLYLEICCATYRHAYRPNNNAALCCTNWSGFDLNGEPYDEPCTQEELDHGCEMYQPDK